MCDIKIYSTLEEKPWSEETLKLSPEKEGIFADVIIDTSKTLQTIDGFGGCFNEKGWYSLSALDAEDRNKVLDELFKDKEGMNLSYMRMPIASNDFSMDYYSFDETDGDFDLKDFNIERDHKYLIPFIKEAQKRRPDIKIWASPWCPPAWMKKNKNYACKSAMDLPPEFKRFRNELPKDKEGTEGEDMYICEDKYFDCYARYFGKFIDAYKAEGIPIFAVMPQNEFNSCQPFPSCVWTPEMLGRFTKFLGPEMEKRGVDVFFGTMERADPSMVYKVMESAGGKYVKGVGFQWAGKGAIKGVHAKYPQLKLIQSEHECMNGTNTWLDAWYTWHMMAHYFKNGASAYDYWNMSLEGGGHSTWGWPQNSFVTVDLNTFTYKWNPEYYIFKHFSRFIQPGAKMLDIETEFDCLAFLNPDDSVVLEVFNEMRVPRVFFFKVNGKTYKYELMWKSLNTFIIPPQ